MTKQTQVRRTAAYEISPDQVGQQQWIQLFPAGRSEAYDGREFNVRNPDDIIAASVRPKVDLVIDREHGRELLPKGTPVPAAGWIKELQPRNGEIWARVEWTEAAVQELKAREFRYISPVFFTDKSGNVTQILGASLVNSPALEMPAVASSEPAHQPNKETPMDPSLTAIASLLGLQNADGPAIVKAVGEMVTTRNGVASGLGIDAASGANDYITAASQKFGKVDPAKFVPVETVQQLQTELATFRNQALTEKVNAAVDAAVKAGKLPPAMKAWGLELAKSDMKAFEAYVASAPVIASNGTVVDPKKADPATGDAQLTEDQKKICALLGVSEKSFLETQTKYPAATAYGAE